MQEKNIVIWYNADFAGCGYLRSIFINDAISMKYGSRKQYEGIISSRFLVDTNILRMCRVMHFQRQATEAQVAYMSMVDNLRKKEPKLYNFKMMYDLDDLFTEIPKYNFAHSYYSALPLDATMKKITNIVDVFTVSTNDMADWIKGYHGTCEVKVVPNYIPKWIYRPYDFDKKVNEKPRILWAGSPTHFNDNDAGDFAVINDLVRNTVDEFDWVILGMRHLPPWIKDLEGKVKTLTWFNISEFPTELKKLNCDFGLAPLIDNRFNRCKCLVGDTKIVSSNGISTIKELYDSSDSMNVWQESTFESVTNKFKYKQQKTVKITTNMGYEIEGTLNHKVRTCGEFKELENIQIGEKIDLGYFNFPIVDYQQVSGPFLLTKGLDNVDVSLMKLSNAPKITINEEWGEFIGIVLGDGHVGTSNHVSIAFNKRDEEVMKRIENFADGIGVTHDRYYKKNKDGEMSNGVSIHLSSRNLNYLLRSIGMTLSKSPANKDKILEIPKIIFQSPKSVISSFLRGLFEADGGVTNGRINFCSKSEILTKQIQFLLLGFGIESRRTARYNKRYERNYYYLYLCKEAGDIFAKEIGFISKYKTENLENTSIRKSNNCVVAYKGDTVANIESGLADVYDIEVPNGNYYLANGIISHNSNIKLLDYFASDIIGIASKLAPYNDDAQVFLTGDWQTDAQTIREIWPDKKKTEDILSSQRIISEKNWLENNIDKYYTDLFGFTERAGGKK